MVNLFKSGTTVSTGSINKNNFIIAVEEGKPYGPTASTGFWTGITPPSGGYTIYNNKASNGPSIFTSTNDTNVITTAQKLGGTNINTINDALIWFNGQSDRLVTNIDYPSIVTSGLSAILDAGYVPSYPKSGSTVYDLSGNNAHGTMTGNVTWVSSGATGAQSYFNFPNGAANNGYIASSVNQSYFDCSIVLMPDFTYTSPFNLVGIIGTSTPAANSDKSLRIAGVNGTGPWSMTSRNPGDGNDWANPNATTFYVNGASGNTLNAGWNVFGGYRTNTTGFTSTFSYFLGSGAYSGDSRSFQGKIAVALLYNRQLSATEQLQNYNALKSRFGLS
jgi:hypothetical protein